MRTKIAVILISVISVIYNIFFFVGNQKSFNRTETDKFIIYVNRYEDVRRYLPYRAVVRYLSDTDNVAEYYLAQYAIAPVILKNKGRANIVLGNFHGMIDLDVLSGKLKYADFMYVDFHNGVFLFSDGPLKWN
ncbi:MAG: hypothetical protein HQK92_10835 [Nitrospirae bacterium]|nr:hypothetical protein [Nitrospirota bacterium]